jgi:hypothetical protein
MKTSKALEVYNAYDRQAKREGWAVFTVDNSHLMIQRIDDPSSIDDPMEKFHKSDQAAIRFVRGKAKQGSKPHQAALTLHGKGRKERQR